MERITITYKYTGLDDKFTFGNLSIQNELIETFKDEPVSFDFFEQEVIITAKPETMFKVAMEMGWQKGMKQAGY